MALHEDNVAKMHAVGHTDDSLASTPYNPEAHPVRNSFCRSLLLVAK